jgi:hypothetical protein
LTEGSEHKLDYRVFGGELVTMIDVFKEVLEGLANSLM